MLWENQAIGSIVNLITVAPTEALPINARGECGYRNTAQGVVNVSGEVSSLSASIGSSCLDTDGISAFEERPGGKEKDGYRSYGANANFTLAGSDAVSVDLRGWYSDSRAGFDGSPPPNFNLGDTPDYGTTREIVGYTRINTALFYLRLHNRFGVAITDARRRSCDGPPGGWRTAACG